MFLYFKIVSDSIVCTVFNGLMMVSLDVLVVTDQYQNVLFFLNDVMKGFPLSSMLLLNVFKVLFYIYFSVPLTSGL